jgi:hypothetical protein
MVDLARKKRKCPFCAALQGKVKKLTSAFKLVHELKHKDAAAEREMFISEFETAAEDNKALKVGRCREQRSSGLWKMGAFDVVRALRVALGKLEQSAGGPDAARHPHSSAQSAGRGL